MAIQIADNFSYLGRKPLDGRLAYATAADMAAMADSTLYEGIIAYLQSEQKYYTFSPYNPVDPTYGKWVEFSVGGNAVIEEYAQATDYKKDTLVVKDGKLYIVNADFTSDDTAGSLDDSFGLDVTNGNLVAISMDADQFQPKAPEKHTLEITDPSGGYIVGDIVRTTMDGIYAKVLEVDDSGAITKVENAPEGAELAESGAGAVITATPVYQVGYDGDWYDMPTFDAADADAKLVEEIKSNVDVGGALSGTMFPEGMTFTEFAKTILRQTVIPKIAFTVRDSGVHERGSIVNGTVMKLKITNLADVTTSIDQIQFTNGTDVLQTFNIDAAIGPQDEYVFEYPEEITDDIRFTVKVTYNEGQHLTKEAAMKFVYPSFVGAVDSLTPDADTVKTLNKVVKDAKSFTWTNANLNDQHFCYAYPASFGNLVSIKDANNFEYINSYTKSELTIDTVQYNLYVLTDPVTISGAMQDYS